MNHGVLSPIHSGEGTRSLTLRDGRASLPVPRGNVEANQWKPRRQPAAMQCAAQERAPELQAGLGLQPHPCRARTRLLLDNPAAAMGRVCVLGNEQERGPSAHLDGSDRAQERQGADTEDREQGHASLPAPCTFPQT